MSEETQVETTPTAPETGAPTVLPTTPTETGASVDEQIKQAVEAATKKANAEALKFRKQLEALEEAETKRKEAEMSEMDKLKVQYEKAEAELKRLQTETLKRSIAAKVGLPDELALRLQGETEDELEADAKALLAALPKTEVKKTLPPTHPGAGSPQKETDAQKKARLLGITTDNISLMFPPEGGQAVGE